MPHSHPLLIGAFAASGLLAWTGAACAETGLPDTGDLSGPGYFAEAAPLGAPTELRIDITGRVASRCDLVAPPVLSGKLALNRAGAAQGDFKIDCNTPFTLRVHSGHGGMASTGPTPGAADLAPYEISVAVDTDAGRHDLGWCPAAALADAPVGACAYGAGTDGRGWSSQDETAIGKTGALRLRWKDNSTAAPLLGAYADTLIVELEVRS